MAYFHDDSDSLSDWFGMAVFLEGDKAEKYGDGKGVTGDIMLFDGKWNVTVIPVNDKPFKLRTEQPSMTVVARQSKPITSDNLRTEDADNSGVYTISIYFLASGYRHPYLKSTNRTSHNQLNQFSFSDFDLVYEIVNSPSHGHLVFAENITLPIKRFTQADVNRKRVIYFHSSGSGGQRGRGGGGGRLKPDDFYFKVSDGQHDPVYRHFRIHIIPLELNLANLTAIQIQQVSKFWSQ